jgi:hypothetical protein
LEGRYRGLILRYYPSTRLEGLRKTTNHLSQDNLFPGQDLKPRPPDYEAGVLTTRPRRSVLPTKESVGGKIQWKVHGVQMHSLWLPVD